MKIAIIGITGNVGSRVAQEALGRQHEVLGIARNVSAITPRPGLVLKRGDVAQGDQTSEILRGSDVVISAVKFTTFTHAAFIRTVKLSGTKRLAVVGGAGSLEVAPGVALVDTPEFPTQYKAEASAGRDFLNLLRGDQELNWTFLSPPALLVPGVRTGKFRLGGDQLLVNARGESKISIEDYAIALIDEVESALHLRQRFTVGY